MKNLSLVILLSSSVAFSQSLEQRVENLEFKSYENYTKVTGSVEYRFDSYSIQKKKDYNTFNVDTASLTSHKKDENKGAGFESVFASLGIESKPSDKVSFYGKLSMAKYSNHFSTDGGDRPEDLAFSDLSRGSARSSSTIFVERAFANIQLTKNFTLTMGRIPTSHGAPRHFSSNEPRKGNYPVLSFGGNWDGLAGSYNLKPGHTLKLVYTPVQSIPFKTGEEDALNDSSGDSVKSKIPAYAFMYEFEKANFAASRRFYLIGSFFTMDKMPTFPGVGSDLYLTLQRTSIYTELSGVNNSNFDLAFHAVSTTTKSDGSITGLGGWLTSEDSDTKTGLAYGALVRYAVNASSKVGLEYFHGGEDAFLYDSANQNPVSIYTTYGDAYHVFYSYDYAGAFKVVLGNIMRNVKYTRLTYSLLGGSQEIDNTEVNTYLRLITKF